MSTLSVLKKIYHDAFDHCRWKHALIDVLRREELQEQNLHQFSNKSFNEIIQWVYDICHTIKGIGILTVYDIASVICRYNNINIDKIYIIGNGPKRTLGLLNIKAKTQKIGRIRLKYIEIPDLLNAFDEKKYEMPSHIRHSNNGDEFETFICNWQKNN
jgi:hypothetical protein